MIWVRPFHTPTIILNMKSCFSTPIAFAAALLFFQEGLAQTEPDSIRTYQLEDVVVTAQYSPQVEKNAVYDVEVLRKNAIERKGATNLREALQHELGFSLAQKTVFGSSAEIRGISKENVKILVDGVPVIGRLNGIIDLGQIPLSNIERVEIIKGPVSVFYGTDAMGGVINLITKKHFESRWQGSVSTYFESIGAMNLDLLGAFNFGKNSLSLDGAYYSLNGLTTTEAARSKNWEEKQQAYANLQFARRIKSLSLRYAFGIFDEELVSLGDTVTSNAGAKKITDANYFTRRINNSLSLQGALARDHFLDLTLSYLDYKRFHDTYNIDLSNGEPVISTTDTRDKNEELFSSANLRCQIGTNAKRKLNYALGTDAYYETAQGDRILDLKQGMMTAAFFGSLNYRAWSKVEFQPGIRYSYNNVFGSVLSPAFSAKLTPGKNQTLRFSYARGFRAPNIKELYLDFHVQTGPVTYIISGNEDLEAEKSHSFELGYGLDLADGKLRVEPTLFYNDIEGLIALTELVDNKRHYFNIDHHKSKGGSLFFTWSPSEALRLKTGATLIGRYNKFTEDFDTDKFTNSPELMAAMGYEEPGTGIRADIEYKYTGKATGFYIDATGLAETERDDFSILNLSLSKSFSRLGFDVFTGVKNILDVQNIETLNTAGAAHSSDMQLWGRSYFVKLKYKFMHKK